MRQGRGLLLDGNRYVALELAGRERGWIDGDLSTTDAPADCRAECIQLQQNFPRCPDPVAA